MGLVNHLKGVDAQKMFIDLAYGKHLVTGDLTKSIVTGSDGSHTITLQHILGRGPWDGCEGLWFKGLEIEAANYKFYPGIQSPGMGDATQGQDSVFNTDTPHSGVSWLRAALPVGVGAFDTKKTPPEGLKGIFRTMKVQDYDEDGEPVGPIVYSPSAALQIADLILRIGGRPTSRIDWPYWCEWRDAMAASIPHDYTALPGQDGFGLSAKYYNGTDFDTLVTERVEPVLEFVESAGSPGVDVDVDNFSARFEGYIRFPYTEEFTLYGTHTHGLRVWIDDLETPLIDQWGTTGEHSATFEATEGTFYQVRAEWKHTTGNAELRFEWESDSQDRDVVTHRALFPKTVERPRYETHPFFSSPTRLDDAVRTILSLCNSTYQEVNGRLRFFCMEQITSSSYAFTKENIVDGSVKVIPRDPTNLRNSWKARFRNVDSQYLDEDIDPLIIERDEMIEAAGRKIDGDAIDIFNCSRHQAYRTLENIVADRVDPKWVIELAGNGDSYPVLAGDQVDVEVEFLNWPAKRCRVQDSHDSSSESTADERRFVLAEIPE